MALTAESVVIELLAKTDGFDAKVRQATGRGKAAVKEVEAAATSSAAGFNRAEGGKATAVERASRTIVDASKREVSAIESVTTAAETGATRQAAAAARGASAVSRAAATMERDANASLGGIATGASRIAGSFGGLLAGVSTLALAKEFLSLADASKQIDSQLRLATATFGTFAQAQTDVARIATETRTGLTETASLYGNFARASEQMGKSQGDAARATETFSKALAIGGADANAAASATLQFGQALASGVLRGDEFNAITEASPRILKLLADSLGVSQGSLRAMAAEGKLTADVLYRALTDRKFTAGIDAEFKQLPVTFDQAMTTVHNAAITTFGAFDRGGQFSTALANFVTQGSEGFTDLESRAEDFGRTLRAEFAGLGGVFGPLMADAKTFFDFIQNNAPSVPFAVRLALNPLGTALSLAPNYSKARTAEDQRLRSAASYQASQEATRDLGKKLPFQRGGMFDDGTAPVTRRPATSAPAVTKKKTGGRKSAKPKAIDYDDTPAAFADRIDIASRNVSSSLNVLQTGVPIKIDDASAKRSIDSLNAALDNLRVAEILDDPTQRRLEQFAEGFTRDLSDGLAYAITQGGSLGDVLVNSLKRAAAEALSSGFTKLLGGGIGSLVGSAGGGGGGLFASAKKLLGFADGGRIVGAGGPRSDSIMARVSNGEFIINADATRKHGPLLDAINSDRLPRFADGGRVSQAASMALVPQGRTLAAPSGMNAARPGGVTSINLTIPVDARGATDPKAVEAAAQRAVSAAAPALLNIAQGRAMQGVAKLARPGLPRSGG